MLTPRPHNTAAQRKGDALHEYEVQRLGGTVVHDTEPYTQWLNDHAEEGWTLVAVDQGLCYFTRALVAPANTEMPYASQSAATLHCTTGEWSGHPTSYAYNWTIAGTPVGTEADYHVKPADVGKTAVCTVTATNAAGTATAPPSNDMVVA